MNSEASEVAPDGTPKRKWYWMAFFWFMVLNTSIHAVEAIYRYYEMPFWLRLVIGLLPVLPFAIVARLHWQAATWGDEMARHIAREIYVFAFYALLAVFLCVDLLRTGGVLPDFVWKTKSLLFAMLGTLAVGHAWTVWRYRGTP